MWQNLKTNVENVFQNLYMHSIKLQNTSVDIYTSNIWEQVESYFI